MTLLHRNKWYSGGTKNYDIREIRISAAAVYIDSFAPEWSLDTGERTIGHWPLSEGSGTVYTDVALGAESKAHGDLSWSMTDPYCAY